MRRRPSLHHLVVFAAIALSVVGCQKKEEPAAPAATQAPKPVPFRVVSMDLGKALDADKRVVAPMTTFGTRDTIYVAIATEGTSNQVTLRAQWSFEDGQKVADDAQSIAPTGPAQTEFHIMKATPWPKGKYAVEVFSDTTSAGRKEFQVQ